MTTVEARIDPITQKAFQVEVRLTRQPEGGYTAQAANLPGAISEGDSLDQALAGIREALELMLGDYLKEEGSIPWVLDPHPPEEDQFCRKIRVDVPAG